MTPRARRPARPLAAAAALLAAVLAAAPTAAQTRTAAPAADTAPRRLLAAHEQAAFRGVGRLDTGAGYCTATLFSETLALTAAHCVVDPEGRPLPAARLRFRAGFRDGGQQAVRGVRRVATHPAWRFGGGRPSAEEIATDVALLELDAPLPVWDFPNYLPGVLPPPGSAVALPSYGRGRDRALSLQDPCRVLAHGAGVLRLDCEAAPGTSGSPVLRRDEGGALSLVGVISAVGGGASWAAATASALPALEAALAAAGPTRRAVRPLEGHSGLSGRVGGWKTSRPPAD